MCLDKNITSHLASYIYFFKWYEQVHLYEVNKKVQEICNFMIDS